jgi:hypothetical protein
MDRPGGPFAVFGCGYADPMRFLLVAAAVVVASACSVETGAPEGPPERTPTTEPTTTASETTTVDPGDGSTAVVNIGPARYDLSAICATGGAGEVEVSVAGEDVNGLPVVGYIRAFLGEPYVSLQVGAGEDAVLFEPRLEGVLPFDLTETGVEFTEIDFVTQLDLETGDFVPAGVGSVEVDCRSYVRELPPVPFD